MENKELEWEIRDELEEWEQYTIFHSPCTIEKTDSGLVEPFEKRLGTLPESCVTCGKEPPKYIIFQYRLLNGK